jgi:metal-responsive CopG/Arc/MetJ family transcriptional regulator
MDTIITEQTSKSSPRQSTKPAAKPKERVQFDFSEEMLQKLDGIMRKTGAATRAEAMRNALRVYDWFIDTDPDDHIKVIGENNEIIQAFKAKLLL